MEKNVLVPVADGSEELETICIVDVLRRAGVNTILASVGKLEVIASKGAKLIADRLLVACVNDTYDLIALPGGMPGAEHLRDCKELIEALKRQSADGRLYAAICAAPAVALYPHGLLQGRRATCHPNFEHLLSNVELLDAAVVIDGNCITSRGAGTAVEFSLTLVEQLQGKEKAQEVARGMAFMREW
ncbi:MAG: DJ-1 family glyoxalase III [Syntrophorhabdales bacterium]|jgi:4-methyl-5(b-hydroxyethyl)-thiazole monophosphate biosynthesis